MIARLVTKREEARVALLITSFAGLFLLLVVFGGGHPGVFGVSPLKVFAIAMALAGLGPWFAWTPRERVVGTDCSRDAIDAGDVHIAAADVMALATVPAARGTSVAVTYRGRLSSLGVERPDDARRIVESLGGEHALESRMLRGSDRTLALPQLFPTLVVLVLAWRCFETAPDVFRMTPAHLRAMVFAELGGVLCAELSMLLLFVRWLVPGHAIALQDGAWKRHAELHGTIARPPAPHRASERVLSRPR